MMEELNYGKSSSKELIDGRTMEEESFKGDPEESDAEPDCNEEDDTEGSIGEERDEGDDCGTDQLNIDDSWPVMEDDDEAAAEVKVSDHYYDAEEQNGSSEEEAGRNSMERSDGVAYQHLQLDHVDFILDSIDTELSDIINRTENNGKENCNNTKEVSSKLATQRLSQSIPFKDGNHAVTEEGGVDTGLGTSSPCDSREASPKPFHQQRKNNSKRKGKRMIKSSGDWSDTESIASIDVRARVKEVLTKHEPSQHASFVGLPHHSMVLNGSQPSSPINERDDQNVNNCKPNLSPIISNSASSQSANPTKRTFKSSKHKKGKSVRQKGPALVDEENFNVNDRFDTDVNSFSDLESIATEDFERKFEEFAARTHSPDRSIVHSDVASSPAANGRPARQADHHGSAVEDQLRKLVLMQSIRPRISFVKEEETAPPIPQCEGKLPEYMYLKKEITESDIGSDSIWTEDYEAQYWKAGVMMDKGVPAVRDFRRIPPRLDSDRDSVQTEDYESHFNHLMVKQLAGVPLQFYDGVSVASDLDSFQSAEVIEKVEELKTGVKPTKSSSAVATASSKKKRGVKRHQKNKVLTSTPYHSTKGDRTTPNQRKGMFRSQQGLQDTSLQAVESCDSIHSGEVGVEQLLDSSSLKADELDGLTPTGGERQISQRMQFLIGAEEDLQVRVKELETSMNSIQVKKKVALDDLRSLQETAQRSRSEIHKAESIARESIRKAEEIRSELVVLEYQRDQARRELGDIEQNVLFRSREMAAGISPHRMIRSMDNIHIMTSPSLAESQSQAVSEARDLNQFTPVSHDLVDPKLTRNITGERLHEHQNVNNLCATVDRIKDDRDQIMQKLKYASEENATLKREMDILKEKMRATEDKLHKTIEESSQTQSNLQTDIVGLRNQLHEQVVMATELEGAVKDRERVAQSARKTLLEVQDRVHALQKEKEEILRKSTEDYQRLETNKEVALLELRDHLLGEKEGALQQLQLKLQSENEESVSKVREDLEGVRRLKTAELEEKCAELADLKGKLMELEESKESLGNQMRKEAEEQIHKAILTEREVWQMEADQELAAEKRVLEETLGGEMKRVSMKMEKLRQENEHLKESVKNLKEENNKLRNENLAAGREKVEAVSEAREATRRDIQEQLDKMREDMAKEKMRETEKLHQKMKHQEEELGKLRSEVKNHQQREKESLLSVNVEKGDRLLIQEMNEECKKSANILGITPRKIPVFANIKSLTAGRSPPVNGEMSHEGTAADVNHRLPGRSQLHAAVANLKATNDELRMFVENLKEEGKQQQKEVMKERKVKESEIEKLQSSINHEKEERANLEDLQEAHEAEVEELKRSLKKMKMQEKLTQDQLKQKDDDMREVQRRMKDWKEETALKMARKFEEELNRELEQRMLNLSLQEDLSFSHSSGSRSMDISQSGHDASTLKVLKHLQEKVKQLKVENLHLKRNWKKDSARADDSLSSGPDNGQNSSKDHQIYKLEQKVTLLERQLSVAEERNRENASLLSKNSLETTKLENALTQQTKELMKMERAYERLSLNTPPR